MFLSLPDFEVEPSSSPSTKLQALRNTSPMFRSHSSAGPSMTRTCRGARGREHGPRAATTSAGGWGWTSRGRAAGGGVSGGIKKQKKLLNKKHEVGRSDSQLDLTLTPLIREDTPQNKGPSFATSGEFNTYVAKYSRRVGHALRTRLTSPKTRVKLC